MNNWKSYCTCTDLDCPCHPSRHDQGCTPCVRKNQRQGEIPSCFFKLVEDRQKPDAYFFENFADWVKEHKKPSAPAGEEG
ncbi:MAG TPA: hypothetical protein IAB36_01335 [Candidatus Egerieicola pullicola]|uniref:Cytosolic protein n=1 Tax=Candidatus Egerieicola pullicola TaxID=2840775 RepID=A0A9D1AHJ9_9FIRM|nr:hypothetical protein [Candidatus Egerieicola pullicola]